MPNIIYAISANWGRVKPKNTQSISEQSPVPLNKRLNASTKGKFSNI